MSSEEIQDEPWVENEMEAVVENCSHSTKRELAIVERYKSALMNNNYKELEFIRSMGESVRHRVMNIDVYERRKLLGFTDISFSKYGWLNGEVLDETEAIDLSKHNRIELACGENGKWIYGYMYSHGAGAGGGSPLSVFGDIFDTKEEAIADALRWFHKEFTGKLDNTDTTNYNQKHIKETLKAIKTLMLV